MNYKIEKNVSILSAKRGGKWIKLIEKMNIGDSVVLDSRLKSEALRQSLLSRGFNSVVRSLNGKDKGKYRVWKLKKKG